MMMCDPFSSIKGGEEKVVVHKFKTKILLMCKAESSLFLSRTLEKERKSNRKGMK